MKTMDQVKPSIFKMMILFGSQGLPDDEGCWISMELISSQIVKSILIRDNSGSVNKLKVQAKIFDEWQTQSINDRLDPQELDAYTFNVDHSEQNLLRMIERGGYITIRFLTANRGGNDS
jgi:hypothetical protein